MFVDVITSVHIFLEVGGANSGSAGSQMRESVLLDQVYVPSGDTAAGIDVVAEVSACHRLEGLRFAKISVATSHNSAGVNVPNEHTH